MAEDIDLETCSYGQLLEVQMVRDLHLDPGSGQGQPIGAFELPTISKAVHAGGDDCSPLAGLSGFPTVDTCLSSKDIARQNCAIVPKWRFFRSVFPASHVQHISDLHSKFALGPHHV